MCYMGWELLADYLQHHWAKTDLEKLPGSIVMRQQSGQHVKRNDERCYV